MFTTIVITATIAISLGFFIARQIYHSKNFITGKAVGAYEKEKEIFYSNLNNKNTSESELSLKKLEIEYKRGVEEGKLIERKKLQVKIIPKLEVEDGMFSKTLYSGYIEQISYDGFSIGEPHYTLVKKEEKFKEENLKFIAETIQKTVENLAAMYIENDINAKALKIPFSSTKIK